MNKKEAGEVYGYRPPGSFMLRRRAARPPRKLFLWPAPAGVGDGDVGDSVAALAFLLAASRMSLYVTGCCVGDGSGGALVSCGSDATDDEPPLSRGRLRFLTRLMVRDTPFRSAVGVLGVLGRLVSSSRLVTSE